MNVYERIDFILKERHISRRKLAELAGIPPTSLQSAFARKVDNISTDMLKKIAAALDCSVDYLLGNVYRPDERLATPKENEEFFADKPKLFTLYGFDHETYIGEYPATYTVKNKTGLAFSVKNDEKIKQLQDYCEKIKDSDIPINEKNKMLKEFCESLFAEPPNK